MTRFALAGNMGALGASGSAVSAAIISCSMPGRNSEALANDRITPRREAPVFVVIIDSPLFDKHKFVAGKHRFEEALKSVLLRIGVLDAVGGIRCCSAMQEARRAVHFLRTRRTAIDGQESLAHVISLRRARGKHLRRQFRSASLGQGR